MAAFSDVETSVRASSDMASDTGRTPQAMILAFANEEYEEVVRRIAEFAPDPYRAISSDLVCASGASTIDVSGLTNAMQILEVQRKEGSRYFGLEKAGVNAEVLTGRTTWRQRGYVGSSGAVIDLFQPERAPGTYRVLYTVFPGALTVSPDAALKLPLGGRKYLSGCVSARVKYREEEDESFMVRIRDEAFAVLRTGLEGKGGVVGTRGRY